VGNFELVRSAERDNGYVDDGFVGEGYVEPAPIATVTEDPSQSAPAIGTTVASAVGSASGTGAAAGVGASIAAAVGNAAGVGTATGVTPDSPQPQVIRPAGIESQEVFGLPEVKVSPPDPLIILHQEMLRRIAALESVIAEMPRRPVGIGHNGPPEWIDDAFDEDNHQAVASAISVLKSAPTASPEAASAASTLRTVGERIWDYLIRTGAYIAKQGDTFASEAAKSAGAEFGKRLVQSPFWFALASSLMAVAIAASDWLAALSALN